MQTPKPKPSGNCFNCEKACHQAHEYKLQNNDLTRKVSKFQGHCYNFQKCGHRAHECRLREKSNWLPKKQTHIERKGNSYNWDYNTQYSCHYYGEYGHIPENHNKINLRGN